MLDLSGLWCWRFDGLRLQQGLGTHELQLKFVSLANSTGHIRLQSGNLGSVRGLSLCELLQCVCGLCARGRECGLGLL